MQSHCSSDRRCYATFCEPCAWRYTLNISRRILRTDPRRLLAATFAPTIAAQTNFRLWRVQVRNLVDYRRRECRWWHDVGLWGWLNADESIKGVVSLGSVLEDEFLKALERRWPTTLRPIIEKELRNEVYFAIRPSVIAQVKSTGRYQSIRLAVEPQGYRLARVMIGGWTERSSSNPLPVLV